MRALGLLLLPLLGTSGLANAATADPFCDGLKAIIAAGAEADPFKSMRGAKGDGDFAGTRALPGFPLCRTVSAVTWPEYACHRMKLTAATAGKVEEDTKTAVERCLGGQMRRDEERGFEPYALWPKGGDYPVLLVSKIGDTMVTVQYVTKK